MKYLPVVFCVCLFLVVSLVLFSRELALLPDGRVHVRFLDVGEGDSALLTSPTGKVVVIDGGPDLSTLQHLGTYLPFSKRTIDLLILSHPQLDHLASFPEILRRYTVRSILFTGRESADYRYQEFLSLAKEQHIPLLLASPSRDIDLGDGLILDILWPPEHVVIPNVNNASIILRAVFGSHSILFTGDAEKDTEEALLALGIDVRSTILKIPHHGSNTSDAPGFFEAVHPEAAVISVGKGNPYGHPSPLILQHLKLLNVPVHTTEDEGTISFVFSPSS